VLATVLLIAASTLSATQVTEASNYEAVQRAINSSRASVRVVNLWATWCAPCVAEMPDLQKLSARFPKIAFIGVSLDDALPGERAEMKTKVVNFLHDRGVKYPNVYFTGKQTELTDRLNFEALPVTVVFDAKGKELARVTGRLNYDSFSKQLAALEKQQKR